MIQFQQFYQLNLQSDMLSLLTQTPKYNLYKKVSLESQERRIQCSKKMKKRKTFKRHKKLNIQIVQNSYLDDKIKKQVQFNTTLKTLEKKDMVVVMPYNEFKDLVDLAEKRKRSKTTLKRKITLVKFGEQTTSFKLPNINRQHSVPLERNRTNPILLAQQTESIQLNPRKKANKRLKKLKTQASNYTQQVNNELSKQKFDDFIANVRQKVMQSSFHIQNRSI